MTDVALSRPKRRARWLLAIFVLASAGCDSAEERAVKHYERGLTLAAEGSQQKAMLEFRNAIRLDREHAPSRRELAKALEKRGDLRTAAGNYRAAAEIDPEDAESRWRLAQILLAAGEAAEARRFVDEAVTVAPQDPDALSIRAAIALRDGDSAAAVADAGTAVSIAPDHVGANVILASERMIAGDTDAALARIDALLARAPKELSYNLLKLQIVAARNDAAALGVQLERLAELFPEDTQYRRNLAQWRHQNGDQAGAEADLRRIADAQPDAVEAALDVVRYVREVRGEEAGRVELAARVEAATDPKAASALRRALAEFDLRTGRADEAKASLHNAIEKGGDADSVNAARTLLARILLGEDDRAGATALIKTVLDQDAKNADALALRASLAIQDDRPRDAIADLRLARDVDPENPDLMLLEATAHEREGNLALAGERLAAAARASGYDPAISGRYVQFLRTRNELTAAESVLTETARRHGSNVAVLGALAEVRLQLQDWTGAEEAAAALRRVNAGGAVADQITAAALSGQGRRAESIGLLENLARSPQGIETAMADLVAGYVRAGEIDKATAFLDGVLTDNPSNLRALLLRAELDLVRNDFMRAEERLLGIVQTAPDSPMGYAALARFYMQTGRADEAERIASEGVTRNDTAEVLRFILAQLYEQRGAFAEAASEYERLYALNPASTVYANNLASLLAEHFADDPERMATATRVAQRLRGYNIPYFQDTYGWVTFLQGEPEAALRSLAPAAEALPDNPVVRYHAGRAYAAVNQPEVARSHLEAALALDPDFPKAESARAALAALPPPASAGQ